MTGSSDARLQLVFAAKNLAAAEIGRLNRGLNGLKGTGSALQGGLTKLAKIGVGGLLLGFGALTGAIGAGIAALKDQAKIDAQTGAVLKSTGNAAHVTAKHVDELANAIKDYSGVDDDAIKQGQNMLLTFTEIRNGVGKANQVFDQATKTLIDMSVALGVDPQKQAVALGKALNDPVKGVTALTKVGVTFTDQQKKQIAAMVKSGNVMGAQKVILKELNREFGGSAKAVGDSADGAWSKLKNTVGDLTKQLAGFLMPAFVKAVTFVRTDIVPAIAHVAELVGDWFEKNRTLITGILSQLIPALASVGRSVNAWFADNQPLIAQIRAFATTVLEVFIRGLRTVVRVFTDFGPLPAIIAGVTAAVLLLSAAVRANPIIAIASAIVLAVGALATAWESDFGNIRERAQWMYESFKKGYDTYLKPVVEAIATVITQVVVPAVQILLDWVGRLAGFLWGGGKGPLAIAVGAIGDAFGLTMRNFIVPAINILKGAVDALLAAYRTAVQVADWLRGHDTGKTHFEYGVGVGPSLGGNKKARGGPTLPGRAFSFAENGTDESWMMPSGAAYVLPDGGFSARQASGGDGGIPPHTHPIYLDGQRVDRMLDRRGYYDLGTQAPTLSRA